MENLDQIVEAIVFASGNKINKKDLLKKFPVEVSRKDINKAIRHLAKRYSGKSGIHFNVMDNEVQFTTNPDYGEIVADVLRVTKEKELSKVLLEVLSIIAYKGPITKTQIEDIRNTNSEYAVSALCRFNLIYPCGRADTLGKPMLYKTTPEFLQKFGLKSLKDLPDKETVLNKLKDLEGDSMSHGDGLFREVDTSNLDDIMVDSENMEEVIENARLSFIDKYMDTDEVPDFLDDEDKDNIQVIGDDDEDDDFEDDNDDSFFDDEDEEDEDEDDDDDIIETSDFDENDDDFDDEDEEESDDEFDLDSKGGLYD